MSECSLCTKLADPAAPVVWQFPNSVALLGPWQFHTGYCVLVSRIHAKELFDLPTDLRKSFLDEMCLLAQALNQSFQPRKMNYEMLGNQVPHLHWHLFPRRHDDHETLQAVWLALARAENDADERLRLQTGIMADDDIVLRIREALKTLQAPTLI